MPDHSDVPPARFTHREIVHMLIGTVLGMFLGALDQTIIATALPAMVGELHGMENMSWTVSAYLLTSTSTTPIYGKLSDLYGRRAVFSAAIAIFLAGSVVCGLAHSMGTLIAGRGLQGLGGGGLISLAMAIIADIVPPRERGRYQAYFTTVWTVATLGGPPLGGFLVDVLSWRWVFWINLPVGAAALAICFSALRRLPIHGRGGKIDYLGAAIMVPGIVALLLVTTWAGTEMAWTSPTILGLLAAAGILFCLFVLQERRAADPVVPLRLFRSNVFVIGNGIAFLAGAASVGATIFLPLFLQVVMGASAGNSGLLILPMMIGITIGAIGSSRLVRSTGRYKLLALAGLGIATASFAVLMTMTKGTPAFVYGTYIAVLGFGFGPSGPVVSVAVQNSLDPRDMGTGTSLFSFFRSLGGSFGVALLGAILVAGLTANGVATSMSPSGLLHAGPAAIAALPDALRQTITASFAHSFVYVFLAGAVLCGIGFILAAFFKELPLRSRFAHSPQPAEAVPERGD